MDQQSTKDKLNFQKNQAQTVLPTSNNESDANDLISPPMNLTLTPTTSYKNQMVEMFSTPPLIITSTNYIDYSERTVNCESSDRRTSTNRKVYVACSEFEENNLLESNDSPAPPLLLLPLLLLLILEVNAVLFSLVMKLFMIIKY